MWLQQHVYFGLVEGHLLRLSGYEKIESRRQNHISRLNILSSIIGNICESYWSGTESNDCFRQIGK